MSDPTRIVRDSSEAADAHRAAAPSAPDATQLDRVRVRAERLAAHRAERPAWRRPVVIRTALVATSVVAAVALSLVAFNRPADVAFARDKLLAVLAPAGTVLHYVEASQNAALGLLPEQMKTTTDYWIDAENEVLRAETRRLDGELQSVKVQSKGRERYLTLVQSDDPDAPAEWGLLEMPARGPLGAAGARQFDPLWWLDRVREAVANGDARVAGTTRVDGEPCWELEWTYAPDPRQPTIVVDFTATVRQRDYRPVRHATTITEGGKRMARYENEVASWEVVPSERVDPLLFDRTALTEGAIAFDNRIYTAEDVTDFDVFEGWWLGAEFEGKSLTGMLTIADDGTESAGDEVTYNRVGGQGEWLPPATEGELVAVYSDAPADEGRADDVRVVVTARVPGDLEALLTGLGGTNVTQAESGGRSYVSADRDGDVHALVNLGDATILVVGPDEQTVSRAVGALRPVRPTR